MHARSMWVLALLCSSQLGVAAGSKPGCPPHGYSQEALIELKTRNFAVANDDERNSLALALAPCLADADPKLRDGVAFEALSTFMRGKQLRAPTAVALMEQLVPWLSNDHPDPQGVARPFAVLVLSEVARMDRIEPFMSTAQREALLSAGVLYMQSVRDYRGFDELIGWRHGVAHSADLLLQLAINNRLDQTGLERILNAIATQVAPAAVPEVSAQVLSRVPASDVHFYVYGESERLARPVFYVAQRQVVPVEVWRAWVQRVVAPMPFAQWRDVFGSQAGLAKRHNTLAFLNALYVFLQESGDAPTKAALLPLITDALKQIS